MIYGFQGATPEICADLVARLGLRELPLTQNFRYSRVICNVTVDSEAIATLIKRWGDTETWRSSLRRQANLPDRPERPRDVFAERLAD